MFRSKKHQNGNSKSGTVEPGSPPLERKSKLSALGKLFRPWKWKKKKKSDKIEKTAVDLERKISVRSSRDELIRKGVLKETDQDDSQPEIELEPVGEDKSDTLVANGNGPNQGDIKPPHEDETNHNTVKFSNEDGRNAVVSPSQINPQIPPRDTPNSGPAHHGANSAELKDDDYDNVPPPLLSDKPPPPAVPPKPSNMTFHPSSNIRSQSPTLNPMQGPVKLPYPVPADRPMPPPVSHFREEVIDTTRFEEVPAREPNLNLKPIKSALKGSRQKNSPVKDLRSKPKFVKMARIDSEKENIPDYDNLHSGDYSSDDDEVLYRDDDDSMAAKVARKDSLARFLNSRPHRKELVDRNIIPVQSWEEKELFKEKISHQLTRRLSLRPSVEELEEKNILHRKTDEEYKKDREALKSTLIRKLSFRPTVEELKDRKIIKFNDYVELTEAIEYDRRADKPWTRLTPKDKATIRRELNEFKSSEMPVHEDSRHMTRYHRP